MSPELILGVLLKVTAASFALNLAAEKATEVIAVTWYPKAHSLARVVGLDGLSSLLGCFGLSLAFLSVACGIVMGSAAAMMKKQTRSFLETGCIGLTVFLGCGIAGALLGSASMTLITLGLRGLCVMGFALSLTLLLIYKQQQQIAANPTRILTFLAVTFMTMHLGVCSGQVIDSNKPRICIVMIVLLPAGFLMGFLADIIAFRKPSVYMTVSFVLLVPLTGLMLGLGIENYSQENPFFNETFYTIQSLVYTLEMLTGLIGALLGVMSVYFWGTERAKMLSLWISVPAAVILYNLDVDAQHVPHHTLIDWCFGAGGVFGLISGLAGASGVSLGLVVMSTREHLWSCTVVVFGVVFLAIHNEFLVFNNIVVLLALPFAQELLNSTETPIECVSGSKVTMLLEAALSFAVLGVVMMGATVLGAAGLLTAALGSEGLYGVTIAIVVAVMKAINVSTE